MSGYAPTGAAGEYLNAAEVTAVARDLGVPESDVREMESRLAGRDTSFDPDPTDDEDRAYLVPAEQLSGVADNDPAQIVEDADWDRHYQAQLQRSLSALDERTRDILVRRYLIEPKATLHELAAKAERATAAGERWVIHTEQHADEGGRVVVELAQATDAEAARALAMLRGLS
jgi:DNA-directed RNA polymerase sigma subunit (sigma70/sigma32)